MEDKVERDSEKGGGDQPRTGSVKTGEAEVPEELPGAGGKFRDDLSRRDGNRICSVEPFAGANPRDDQRELERRSQHIGNLQNRLIQTQQNASRDTAQRGCPKKRVDRNHAANRERQREARRRGALRELPRDRRNDTTFPPRRCRCDLVNCVHATVGSGDQIDAERSGDERGRKRQPTRVAPGNNLGEL